MQYGERFIPASAGNTAAAHRAGARVAVHPRERGEHKPTCEVCAGMAGSSPRARGTRDDGILDVGAGRFIPASAGNTPGCCAMCRGETVHPRERGEHAFFQVPAMVWPGSSPRARGTRLIALVTFLQRRFIPASAGNTSESWIWTRLKAVHPRERGEHTWSSRNKSRRRGSSPRARGTHVTLTSVSFLTRFIPASAGNTPRLAGRSDRSGVHPRERGEHVCQFSQTSE